MLQVGQPELPQQICAHAAVLRERDVLTIQAEKGNPLISKDSLLSTVLLFCGSLPTTNFVCSCNEPDHRGSREK